MYIDFPESISPQEAFNDDEEHAANLSQILEAKDKKVDAKQVAENQKHLTVKQHAQLAALLSTYTKLCRGTLGLFSSQITLQVGWKCSTSPSTCLSSSTFKSGSIQEQAPTLSWEQ